MNPILRSITDELEQTVTALKAIGSNEPLNIVHNVWNGPGTTRDELVQKVEALASWISKLGTTVLARDEALVADYTRRLTFMRTQTAECVNDFATPGVINLLCSVVYLFAPPMLAD